MSTYSTSLASLLSAYQAEYLNYKTVVAAQFALRDPNNVRFPTSFCGGKSIFNGRKAGWERLWLPSHFMRLYHETFTIAHLIQRHGRLNVGSVHRHNLCSIDLATLCINHVPIPCAWSMSFRYVQGVYVCIAVSTSDMRALACGVEGTLSNLCRDFGSGFAMFSSRDSTHWRLRLPLVTFAQHRLKVKASLKS